MTGGGAFTVSGATSLLSDASITSGNGAVTLGTVDGAQSLAINAGTGTVAIGDAGTSTALTGLTIAGTAITLNDVTTQGPQSFTGAVNFNSSYATGGGVFAVNGPLIINSTTDIITGGGVLALSGGIEPGTSASPGFILDTGAGDILIAGNVGAGSALGPVTIQSAQNVSFSGSFASAAFSQVAGTGTSNFFALNVSGPVSLNTANLTGSVSGGSVNLVVSGAIGTPDSPLQIAAESLSVDASGGNLEGTIGGLSGAQAIALIQFAGNALGSSFTFSDAVVGQEVDTDTLDEQVQQDSVDVVSNQIENLTQEDNGEELLAANNAREDEETLDGGPVVTDPLAVVNPTEEDRYLRIVAEENLGGSGDRDDEEEEVVNCDCSG